MKQESSGRGTAWCRAQASGSRHGMGLGAAESRSCGWAEVHDSLDDSCCDKLDLDIGEVELYGGELDLDGGVLQVIQS